MIGFNFKISKTIVTGTISKIKEETVNGIFSKYYKITTSYGSFIHHEFENYLLKESSYYGDKLLTENGEVFYSGKMLAYSYTDLERTYDLKVLAKFLGIASICSDEVEFFIAELQENEHFLE